MAGWLAGWLCYTYVAGLTPAKFVLGENAKLICNRRSEAAYVGVRLGAGYRRVKRTVVPNFCNQPSYRTIQYLFCHRRALYSGPRRL